MRLRASDYEVRDIPLADARSFIEKWHYSKGCSKTRVYAHGLFGRDSNELLGVAQWIPPTKVAAQTVNPDEWRRVLSLSRLAVHPDVPQNGATFLMARSIRLIRQDGRFVSLVTYADEYMGHTGAIYRAANWQYVGQMKGCVRWEDDNGKQVAQRATRNRSAKEMRELGYRAVGRFRKHKFVMHLKIQQQGAKKPIAVARDSALFWALAA